MSFVYYTGIGSTGSGVYPPDAFMRLAVSTKDRFDDAGDPFPDVPAVGFTRAQLKECVDWVGAILFVPEKRITINKGATGV